MTINEIPHSGETATLIRLNQDILQAEEDGNQAKLDQLLHPDFTIVRSSGELQDRQTFLNKVPDNKNRGRTADQVEVRIFDHCAVFTCRLTTAYDKNGNPAISHFWNTQLFVRQGKEWYCIGWQVMKICND